VAAGEEREPRERVNRRDVGVQLAGLDAERQRVSLARAHPGKDGAERRKSSSVHRPKHQGVMMATTAQLVTGVDFVPFSTRDLDQAMDFYGTKLGLPRSVHVPERQYAEFETGNVTLSIINGEAMGIGHNVNHTAMALHVDDVAAARATLEERGVKFAGGTLDTGVCHMAFFTDPDGNALMLHHRYAPRSA
jgi:predicted enzyme related to lactoylglutathione lyase